VWTPLLYFPRRISCHIHLSAHCTYSAHIPISTHDVSASHELLHSPLNCLSSPPPSPVSATSDTFSLAPATSLHTITGGERNEQHKANSMRCRSTPIIKVAMRRPPHDVAILVGDPPPPLVDNLPRNYLCSNIIGNYIP
jgi:hypothetical protein